jgi:hypothetical protein
MWPSHLMLCTLINLCMSAPSINLSITMLFRILHILSILTGPNIFLSTGRLYPQKRKYTWYSFLLQAESIP